MKKLLCLLSFLLLIGVAGYAQKNTVALHLVVGKTYYLSTTAKLEVNQNINGQDQDITTTITAKMAHKILSVKDSIYEMEITYQSMAMQMAVAGQNLNFNTDKKDTSDIVSAIMASLINKPFTVEITKTGKIKSIQNIDNIYKGMFDKFPKITEAQKAQFKTQMEQSFGEKSFKGNLEEAFAVFPSIPVAKSDKWTVVTKLESVLSIDITTTFTLADVTADAYVLHGEAQIQPGNNSDYKEVNGIPMKFTGVTGTTTTDVKLDKASGWVTESKAVKKIDATVDIKDNPKVPGGLTFPMTITADIAVTGK
jgi:hypothetical protein